MKTLPLIALLLTASLCQAMGMSALVADPELNLSVEQKEQIVEKMELKRLEMIDLRAVAQKADLQLDMAIRKGEESIGKLEKRIDDVAAARATIEKKRLRALLEVRSLLNEEQQVVFDLRYATLGRRGPGGSGPGSIAHAGFRGGRPPHGPPNAAAGMRRRHPGPPMR